MVSLILGGVRSGKSHYAQRLAMSAKSVVFLATAVPSDEEMRLKIEKHRKGSGLVIPCYRHDLQPLFYQHAYLRKLASDTRLNDSGCTGSCC